MALVSVMFASGMLMIIVILCCKVRSDTLKVIRDLVLIVGCCLIIAASIMAIASAISKVGISW